MSASASRSASKPIPATSLPPGAAIRAKLKTSKPSKVKQTPGNFLDTVTLLAKGGIGGDGTIAWKKHTSHKAFGPGRPQGGRGGEGGYL
jgi:hypothetical protein